MANATLIVKITDTNWAIQMIAQAIHDEFLPGADGHGMCNHSGGARDAIQQWAQCRGITLEDKVLGDALVKSIGYDES